jgi:hypothetical protein
MLATIPAFVRVPLVMLLLALNIVMHVTPLFVLTFFKVILPIRGIRLALSRALVLIAESWIAVNSAMFEWFTTTRWTLEGLTNLRYDGNYLVLCNHQSWVDIPVLQKIFNRRIPFLRFFLKSQLVGAGFSLHEALFERNPRCASRAAGQGHGRHAPRLRKISAYARVRDEFRRRHALYAGQAR